MYEKIQDLLEECRKRGVPLWRPVLENECRLTESSEEQVWERLKERCRVMEVSARKALKTPQETIGGMISGLASTQAAYAKGPTICGGLINRVMAMALSASEVNAAMGRICAAPTAGSCGILPAVLFGLQEEYGYSEQAVLEALLTAAGLGAGSCATRRFPARRAAARRSAGRLRRLRPLRRYSCAAALRSRVRRRWRLR